MLLLKRVFNVLVQLLVAASRFGCVEIAAANYMQVGGREVEGICDDLEVAKRNVLEGNQQGVDDGRVLYKLTFMLQVDAPLLGGCYALR